MSRIACSDRFHWVAVVFVTTLVLAALVGCGSATPAPTAAPAGQQPAAAPAKSYNLKFASAIFPDQSSGKQFTRFAEIVKQKSNGAVNVELFLSGTLAGERTAIEAVINGTVDIGTSANPQWAPFSDSMLWMDLPYMVDCQAGLRKVLDGPIGDDVRKSLEQKPGVKVLLMTNNGGGRPVFTVSKKLKVPADLKGLKIRSVASPVDQAIWRAWGASPTPIDWAEVYSSFQSKVIDGYGPNWDAAVTAKHVELLKYAVDVNYIVGVQVAGMRLDKFNALPADIQNLLVSSGKETEQWGIPVDLEITNGIQEVIKNQYKIEIYKPTPEEFAQWKSQAQTVYPEFAKQAPSELIDRVRKAAEGAKCQ